MELSGSVVFAEYSICLTIYDLVDVGGLRLPKVLKNMI
jgi:hypothetical protein